MVFKDIPGKKHPFLAVSILVMLVLSPIVFSQAKPGDQAPASQNAAGPDQINGQGLMGYISSKALQPSAGYGAGVGFYVAVYPILPEPIANFQIGLASTWIIPKNADNTTNPLCPPGTQARDHWPERAPTYGAVFQTIEGGLGIWGSTQFRAGYKPPKFQIVGVPDCYSGNYLISPGWSNRTTAAASEVPEQLRAREFKPALNRRDYTSPETGAWAQPGPAKGPFYANLADGSRVTYFWYRFIDQPALQQYKNVWTEAMKAELQAIVEKIQKNWTPDKEYMPAPRDGKPLVAIDAGLLVTPPTGLEVGYVPIVTRQEIIK